MRPGALQMRAAAGPWGAGRHNRALWCILVRGARGRARQTPCASSMEPQSLGLLVAFSAGLRYLGTLLVGGGTLSRRFIGSANREHLTREGPG